MEFNKEGNGREAASNRDSDYEAVLSRAIADMGISDWLAPSMRYKVDPPKKIEWKCGKTACAERALKFYKDKTGLEYKLISAKFGRMSPVHTEAGGLASHSNFFASLKDADSPVEFFFVEQLNGIPPEILQCELLKDKPFELDEAHKFDDVYHPPGMKCMVCAKYTIGCRSGRGFWL